MGLSKRACKRKFVHGELVLGTALECLMFDHFMDRGQALGFLGL